MSMQIPLIQLQCDVNSYDWGKVGSRSLAAKYAATTPSNHFNVDEDKAYAELWMGAHPKQPSFDLETKRALNHLIDDNKALMSLEVHERYGDKLPFLFKVLSIGKALSIQAHPNKRLAEQLHSKDPKNYPDDNHKPEMTIAISPFEGLCGFRPLQEIANFLRTIPPLRQLVGEAKSKDFEDTVAALKDENGGKRALKTAFTALMNSDKATVVSSAKDLVTLANNEGSNFAGGGGPSNSGQELADLIVRLNGQFEGDIGLFVMFFLNFVKLQVGEAMFLKADDIHAYLSGDIIECMAASDNVVRAGFTPKFQDIPTLTSMLTYNYAPISEQKMIPESYSRVELDQTAISAASTAVIYDPPIDEFAVVKTDLKKSGASATFQPITGPSIIICTSGWGRISVGPKSESMKTGYVFFVGATAECVLESDSNDFTTFKAFCEQIPTR